MKKLRVVICGTLFGQVYLSAFLVPGSPFKLAGILARGSRRSRQYAGEFGVPLYRSVDEVPGDVDVACIVIRSTIAGGEGTVLAMDFLKRGIHVIQEHPVHNRDIEKCLNLAEEKGVCYHVNSHYPYVTPVADFINYINKAGEKESPMFIEASCSVQTSFSLLDIIGRSLGGLSPVMLSEPVAWGQELRASNASPVVPFRCLQGVIKGIPFTFKIQNFYDPEAFDNNFLIMHRLCIGMYSGNLSLVNTHGPVVWSQSFCVKNEDTGENSFRLRKTAFKDSTIPTAVTVTPKDAPSLAQVAIKHWPVAVQRALQELNDHIVTGKKPPFQSEEYLSELSNLWLSLVRKLGDPDHQSIPLPSAPFPDPVFYREKNAFSQ